MERNRGNVSAAPLSMAGAAQCVFDAGQQPSERAAQQQPADADTNHIRSQIGPFGAALWGEALRCV